MSDVQKWNEGDALSGDEAESVPVTQAEVDAAWSRTKTALEARGVKFVDVILGGPEHFKFGQMVTKHPGLKAHDGFEWWEKGLRDHFGPLEGGTILVRAAPHVIQDDKGKMTSYVRARFGFRRDA